MISFLRDIVDFAINPLHILVAMMVIAAIAKYLRSERVFRWVIVMSLLFFLLTATSPLPDLMVNRLERQYQSFEVRIGQRLAGPVNILVLGGGHIADPDLPATNQLSTSALTRLVEGVRLHRLIPDSRIITSGYGGFSETAQADILAEAAMALGVDQGDIARMNTPINTFQEALEYKRLYANDSIPLILVTSAVHMPRAMLIFNNRGLDPVAAPTEFIFKIEPGVRSKWFGFSTDNFSKIQRCMHEYIGLLWERHFNHPHQMDRHS